MRIRTLAAIGAALGLSACAAEFSPIAFFAICAPPAPDATAGACVYPATCANSFAGTPLLDATTAGTDFRLSFQITNPLVNNADNANGRVNTNDAIVQSYEIQYPGTSLATVTVPAAVTVPTAGTAGALVPLIPAQYFPMLAPPGSATTTLTLNLRAHGVLASQDPFTTAWFQVPVKICSGCLDFNVCGTGSVLLASCPSSVAGAISPGQSAGILCSSVAQ